jgi:hypothetical protein
MSRVTLWSKMSLKTYLLGTLAVLVAGVVPLEVNGHSPVALAEAQATETVTPTETSAPTATDTATPSPTVTGTPPTATPPPAPGIPFLFAASGSEPQNQWDCSSSLARNLGFTAAVKTFQTISESDPGHLRNTYQVIYVAPDLNGEDYGFLQQMVALNGTIERFVSSGGVAVINVAGANGDQSGIAPDDVGFSAATQHDSETIETDTHGYITGAGFGGEALGAGDFDSWQHTDLGTLTGLPQDATVVLTNGDGTSWAEYRHGDGRVIVTTLTYCTSDEPNSQQAAARNLLRYSSFFKGSAFTPAPTVTLGPRPTATKPPSFSPTASRTLTPTVTPTESPSPTVTATAVFSSTPSETATGTSTATATPTDTPAEATATETATELATTTLTPTELPSITPSPSATETATFTATASATPIATPRCVGDCNGDGVVTVDELLTMVNIALSYGDISTCEAGDANRDGQITVDEVLLAVNNALSGCPGALTPASARHARSAKR